jgi:hypothetical protein
VKLLNKIGLRIYPACDGPEPDGKLCTMAVLDIVLAEGSEGFYHEVLEDSIETGPTFL